MMRCRCCHFNDMKQKESVLKSSILTIFFMVLSKHHLASIMVKKTGTGDIK